MKEQEKIREKRKRTTSKKETRTRKKQKDRRRRTKKLRMSIEKAGEEREKTTLDTYNLFFACAK